MKPTRIRSFFFALPGGALGVLLVFLLGLGTAEASKSGGMTQIDPPEIDLPGEEPRRANLPYIPPRAPPGCRTGGRSETAPTEETATRTEDAQRDSRADANGPGPCFHLSVFGGVTGWDQPDTTAAGDRAAFQDAAPGAAVSSSTDDTAGTVGATAGVSFPSWVTSVGPWLLEPRAFVSVRQTGDFEATTSVRAGGRQVTSRSTFDPGLAYGGGVAAALHHRNGFFLNPYLKVMRQDIDVDISTQFFSGDMLAKEERTKKNITDTALCLGLDAALKAGERLFKRSKRSGGSLGLRTELCEVNDEAYYSFGLFYEYPFHYY